jgi:DNA processing protein
MICSGDDAVELWRLACSGGGLFETDEAPGNAVDAPVPLLEVVELSPRLSDEAVRVLDALRPRRGNGEAELAALAGLSLADTRAGLAELELLGRADLGDTGWRRVS